MVILREIYPREKGCLFPGFQDMVNSTGLSSGCQKPDRQKRVGIAVDIGTTTVVLYLWDFVRGELYQAQSEENCQTRLGADVMMRIMHAGRGKGEELHRILVEQIEGIMEYLLSSWQKSEHYCLSADEIDLSVVGNPAMCHFFLNKDVSGLAGAPFQSAYTGNYSCTGREVGFHHWGQVKIKVLSGIAAHVGGDALAVFGAASAIGGKNTKLMVDLGTNAEMILLSGDKMYCCSTAAGPALEGKGIRCGVRAKPGAITGVKLAPNTGNIVLEYLSGKQPNGITGTGLLELMEGLCRSGILMSDGYLLERNQARERGVHSALAERLLEREGQRGFLLYQNDREIILWQNDIRNVQLAKGAILAGIQCLLHYCNLSAEKVEKVIVAGALGSHLREEAVVRLGLFPAAFRNKFYFIGNGAGIGALKMLIEPEFSREMENKAKEMLHVELADEKDFQKYLLNGMEWREY